MPTQTRNGASQLGGLIAKDLRLHGRAVVLVTVSVLGLLLAAEHWIPRGAGAREAFVFNVNLLLTLLWSDWLITRERAKRTFGWLRSLPLDDRVLALGKFVLAAGWCVALWTISSALCAPELWEPFGTWLVLQIGLVTLGSLSVATKWRFPWRLGHVLPALAILIPLLVVLAVAGDGTDARASLVAFWHSPAGRPSVAGLLLATYTTIVALTTRWVSRADSFELVD